MASTSKIIPLTTDEQVQILHQRMLVDDKLLKRLVKKFTVLLNSKDPDAHEAAKVSYQLEIDSIQSYLARIDTIASTTTNVEIQSYQQELQDIQQQQQQADQTILQLKQQLLDVQKDRANKLEYDAIAVEINKLPTREELKQSLSKLTTSLDGLRQESEKYDDVSKNAAERLKTYRQGLESLHADIGFEVGERERREVERGEGEADPEADESRQPSEGVNTPAAEPESEGMPRSISGLNPAAAAFKPLASESRAASRGSSPLAGRRARKRQGTGTSKDGASDEEGAWEEEDAPSSSRSSKRQKLNGGEALAVDGDSEEEEGSILPPVRRR